MRRHLISFRRLNVQGHLTHMRRQRAKLVQTLVRISTFFEILVSKLLISGAIYFLPRSYPAIDSSRNHTSSFRPFYEIPALLIRRKFERKNKNAVAI